MFIFYGFLIIFIIFLKVNCSKCTGSAACTECVGGSYLKIDGTACLASCPAPSRLNYAKTKCVANCITDDNGNYLSSDSTRCYASSL